MAASVVSLGDTSLINAHAQDSEEELTFVLPSEVDCFGRPPTNVAFSVTLRRLISLSSIRSYLARLRQPSYL